MEESKVEKIDNIKRRLRRIEGQLKGIQKMIDQEAGCMEILVQVSAVRAAISKVGTMVLESHVRDCLQQAIKEEKNDDTLDNLMYIMSNFIK